MNKLVPETPTWYEVLLEVIISLDRYICWERRRLHSRFGGSKQSSAKSRRILCRSRAVTATKAGNL